MATIIQVVRDTLIKLRAMEVVKKGTHMHMHLALVLVIALALARVRAAAASLALPGCVDFCGNVSIPYPFGIGVSNQTHDQECFLEKALELRCDNESKLYPGKTGNVQILNISLLHHQLDMSAYISKVCRDESPRGKEGNEATLTTSRFSISSKDNKFISVGCDTYGYLNSFHNGKKSSTGCLTRCVSLSEVQAMQPATVDESCSGIGCCQVDIPTRMRNISIQASTFDNFSDTWEFNNCSYSFVVKNSNYSFSIDHLKHAPFENEAPFVVDWTVGKDKCEVSKNRTGYACKKNSDCEDEDTDYGYRCKCKHGYEGNPYHPDGCQDIQECDNAKHNCISKDYCHEIDGSFECRCPHGQSGNATTGGGGCHREGVPTNLDQKKREDVPTKVVVGVGVGLLALFVGSSWLYLIYQKRKLIKLKEKFFRLNGGFILQQQLSTRVDSSESTQIFTAEELSKATNNYDESLIIGKGGYGTVFKGFLSNNRIVAIKKSKVVDQNQIEQFINEVVILSQINHRNVVKLLGCCLETEVPLLVYEFVNNGTLFDYLHNEGKMTDVSWKTRLRIATEAAGALSYLHSAASIPIIHRDVKTANILLDDTYTAKVSDFGASRLVPQDKIELATMVQGTLGYLDPEYMQTSQLTEKSDVYSFGVVLVELLTGEKALSFERPEEKRSLAIHFLSCFKEDCLFEVLEIGILNEENKEEIKEVAILAARCLRLRGEERPSMKEVALELEGIRLMDKHQWTDIDPNVEETQQLLHVGSSIHEHGNSSAFGNSGYNSIANHVQISIDDGR